GDDLATLHADWPGQVAPRHELHPGGFRGTILVVEGRVDGDPAGSESALRLLIPVSVEVHVPVLLIRTGIVVAAQAAQLELAPAQDRKLSLYRGMRDQPAEQSRIAAQHVIEPHGADVVGSMRIAALVQ